MKNPGELCCHSAIVVSESMFVYGGERCEGQAISELWRYRFGKRITPAKTLNPKMFFKAQPHGSKYPFMALYLVAGHDTLPWRFLF